MLLAFMKVGDVKKTTGAEGLLLSRSLIKKFNVIG